MCQSVLGQNIKHQVTSNLPISVWVKETCVKAVAITSEYKREKVGLLNYVKTV